MEDPLQKASNDHQTVYYASQLKVMDISQSIRAMGMKFTNNQIKTATLESFNHFSMLEKIFQERQLTHIFQLVKKINQNYNSLIAILLERETKLTNMVTSRSNNNEKQQQATTVKVLQAPGQTDLTREIKKNRLGGIHLFNQNHSRYLEDHRIMDQIKSQKGKRLHRNRLEILRKSIFEELNHKTDVEEYPANNDEITNYILKSKDKNSIFNYVSYQPELQEILTFFQNSQTEANDFLVRKIGKNYQEDGNFQFSEFQREIKMKNYYFKRQIIEKFREFIEKYRKKKEQMQEYISEKQELFKKLQQKHFKRQQSATQTDLNLDQHLKSFDQKLKQTQLRCQGLQNMKKEQLNNNQKESKLIHELAIQQSHIQKLNYKISGQQATIQYIKKLLRQERIKKSNAIKQELQKSRHVIQQEPEKEKDKPVFLAKDNSQVAQSFIQEITNINSASQLRKASYMGSWRRKQSNDGISLYSFNDLEKEHEALSKTEKKRYVRYQAQGKYTDLDKNQTHFNKQKIVQSTEHYAQTDDQIEDQIQGSYIRDASDKLQNLPEGQFIERKSMKKGRSTTSSTPKISSKNVDFNLNKKSGQKKTDKSKKVKQKKDITSLTKIKSQKDFSQHQNEHRKGDSQSSKKNSNSEIKKIVKQQNLSKRQELNKIQKLHFNKQRVSLVKIDTQILQQQEQIKSSSHSVDCLLKTGQKKNHKAYEIFQVVQEQDEENLTIRNTQRSEKMSIYSHKKLQFQLVEKLNRELNRIKQERHCTFQHLYNLTILPYQRYKLSKNGDVKINRTSIELNDPKVLQMVENKSKPEINSLDINSLLKVKGKDYGKSLSGLDDLIKAAGPENQIKKEKLKNWKKKMANNLKSEIITQQQAEQIISVICQSAKDHKQANEKCENSTTPVSSIANHIRNSLPEVEDTCEGKSIKKANGCLRRLKLKTSCQQDEESNTKIHKWTSPEMQKKIQQLIHAESLQPHFKQKFAILHKKCHEGAVCSHINKYFETIMKHYEQSRRKGKQTLVLPIEHIGTRTPVQENLQKENKQIPRINQGEDPHIQKQVSLSKYKNGLSRKCLSQELMLPNIKELKVSNPKMSKFVI